MNINQQDAPEGQRQAHVLLLVLEGKGRRVGLLGHERALERKHRRRDGSWSATQQGFEINEWAVQLNKVACAKRAYRGVESEAAGCRAAGQAERPSAPRGPLRSADGLRLAVKSRQDQSVALACKGPLNARLATGVGLSFFLSGKTSRSGSLRRWLTQANDLDQVGLLQADLIMQRKRATAEHSLLKVPLVTRSNTVLFCMGPRSTPVRLPHRDHCRATSDRRQPDAAAHHPGACPCTSRMGGLYVGSYPSPASVRLTLSASAMPSAKDVIIEPITWR
jgi:hypothetical protein